MDDGRPLAKEAYTSMSVSSSVTGVVLNTALAAVCPIFAGSALVNLWQIGVSSIRHHRVRGEVKNGKVH